MEYRIGMILEGKVTGIQPYGAFVSLDEYTQGLIHISECGTGYVGKITNYLRVGQLVQVMIIDIDEYTGKISLSVRCLQKKFMFFKAKNIDLHHHRKFWTSRYIHDGFLPIKSHLNKWIIEMEHRINAKKF